MSILKIVTDSTADIPTSIIEELDITVVPLNVTFSEGKTYEDGVDLTPAQFYQKLAEEDTIPTTSQPTPFQFEQVYERLGQEGEDVEILSIHLSSKMSGTYQAATIAKNAVDEKVNVTVIDSKRASYATGIIVVELARLVKAGKSRTECIGHLEKLLEETTVYFMVDTLEFLQKNGRIGKASAMLGSLLKIKPILSLTAEGEVYPYEKVRGQKKAINRIIEAFKQQYEDEPIHIGVSHAVSPEVAADLVERIKQEFTVVSEVITDIGPVIGSHVGPGTVSIAVTTAE
ncbi:DegV family protein [Desertibacillus haloalkaliphilus]|uniref:DegV family protein n=1 Tax=Desertibacillus haloalkaliphilus TaxID=1328930 RepID=UPI001C256FB9|nr:DegV family protein [Desertibacillus haloalkaliphilus]MBU8907052.1 DegV family protein [Desertibacillus haloalkaliphilus]